MVAAELIYVTGDRSHGIWKVVILSFDFIPSMIRSHWLHKSWKSCDIMFYEIPMMCMEIDHWKI